MPELPEVEILVRHLAPLLRNETISRIKVFRSRTIAPTSEHQLLNTLVGATFTGLKRRGKYLLFELQKSACDEPLLLLGHLGMTGRMYLMPNDAAPPKHTAVMMDLEKAKFIFEDTRYFGRLTLDSSALAKLGPEPSGKEFTAKYLASALKRSSQAIKVKLLDQSLVAGVGNIYASEALFRAGIHPRTKASKLTESQISRLTIAIQKVMADAIDRGARLALDFAGKEGRDGLFYYGSMESETDSASERFFVYDRLDQPCRRCGTAIRRVVQAARSTYYCPHCQKG